MLPLQGERSRTVWGCGEVGSFCRLRQWGAARSSARPEESVLEREVERRPLCPAPPPLRPALPAPPLPSTSGPAGIQRARVPGRTLTCVQPKEMRTSRVAWGKQRVQLLNRGTVLLWAWNLRLLTVPAWRGTTSEVSGRAVLGLRDPSL